MNKDEKKLLGIVPKERIRILEIARPPRDVANEFLKFDDMSGRAARALDELGIVGAIGSVALKPLVEGKKIVGPAITVRDVPSKLSRYYGIVNNVPSLQKGECEAYFIAEPGDVIVIDSGGQTNASNMGGESSFLAKSRGIAGCVVDGLCTGIPTIKSVGLPVWCRGGTTVTGHHRLETLEINGTISCAGVQVQPGDLIVADDSGVTVVPDKLIQRTLDTMRNKALHCNRTRELIKSGVEPSELGKELAKAGRRL